MTDYSQLETDLAARVDAAEAAWLALLDARRAEVAAKVLREFSKAGHQILIFTCHEHIMEIFQSLKSLRSELRLVDENVKVTWLRNTMHGDW